MRLKIVRNYIKQTSIFQLEIIAIIFVILWYSLAIFEDKL